MSASWLLREAVAGDLSSLLELAQSCDGAPAWSAEVWAQVIGDGAHATFVVEQSHALIGFAVVSDHGATAEIESIAVDPAVRRQGLGRMLCKRAMAWVHDAGGEEVLLEVRASNVVALRLYAALGFVEQGRRRGYYRAPVEDAVLMAARLRDEGPATV